MTKATELEFGKLALKAHEAGLAAGEACVPTPMVVGTPKTLLGNEIDYSQKTYFVADGVCGFAWVHLAPATTPFARWAKKSLPHTHKSYYGGLDISSGLMTQSMARNEAYCRAYAAVLREAGIKAYMQSRID
jgi:hypothetical protein